MLVKRKNKAMNFRVNVSLHNESSMYKISPETNFFVKLERKKRERERENMGGKEVSIYNKQKRVY